MNEIMSEQTDEKRQSPIRSDGLTVQNASGLNRTHTHTQMPSWSVTTNCD